MTDVAHESAPTGLGRPYEPRHVRFIRREDVDGWRLKLYGIALIYWWQSENELHQRIYVSPKDEPIAFTQVENQPTGCVWELAVVDFERRAWLEDVLANSSGPDVERYLERRFDADL